MKLLLKILLFIFTMIVITVGDAKSSTIGTILQEETSSSFIQKSQLGAILFENYNANSCLKEKVVLTYSEQVVGVGRNLAKGGLFDNPYNFYRLEALLSSDQKIIDELVTIFKNQGKWGDVDAIKIFEYNGNKYVLDGHHRLAAAKKANINVKYEIVPESQISRYGYKSPHEIISASTEVGADKIK